VVSGPGSADMTPVRTHAAATTAAVGQQAEDPSLDELTAMLRAAVRGEGIDPQCDTTRVRRLAEGLVRERDEASLTGRVTSVGDKPAVVEEMVARVAGFGPLQRLLDDPEVEEVW